MAQSEVQSGIPQQVFDREFARATMDQILATPTLLSQMKTLYESPHASRFPLTRATRLLTTPQRVAVDAQFTIPSSSPDVAFASKVAYVDALTIVPNSVGLDALLPAFPPDQGYMLQLHFGHRSKLLRGKSTKLGFNPKESLLWIGRCRRDDVWLGLADRLPEEAPLNTQPIHGRLKNTVMPLTVYNMMLMFFAHSMSFAAITDIYVNGNNYPEDIDSPDCIRRRTSLL